jgi:hypothetical protein
MLYYNCQEGKVLERKKIKKSEKPLDKKQNLWYNNYRNQEKNKK